MDAFVKIEMVPINQTTFVDYFLDTFCFPEKETPIVLPIGRSLEDMYIAPNCQAIHITNENSLIKSFQYSSTK